MKTERLIARRRILAKANGLRKDRNKLSMRQLQLAVSIVRRRGLVKPEVLIAAGFNAPPDRPVRVAARVERAKAKEAS